MNKDIKICFMGTPIFGRNVLKKLIEEYTVVLVVTQPDKPNKRGNKIEFSPVKELAVSYNIPVFQPENIKEDHSLMEEYSFDFLVTAAYGQFIPLDVLHLPKFKTLNVHGSDLPKYRGGAPIQRAIMQGDEYLGVTVMHTILKMDAGVMYKKSLIKLEDSDTTGTMMEKLSIKGSEDLVEVINKMYEDFDSVIGIHQDVSKVTFSPNISKEEEIIDFNKDARDVFNSIRALNPDPIMHFSFKGENYKVYSSHIVINDSNKENGEILENRKELIIKCAKDAIAFDVIQPQSKKPMNVKDFLNGSRAKFNIGEIIK